MKKVVVKLGSFEDSKMRQKALKTAAGMHGVESVSIDMKANNIIVICEADPVKITASLRKFGGTELVSVGPAKDEKKDATKKEDDTKKDENKPSQIVVYCDPYYNWSSYPAPLAPAYRNDHYNTSDSCSIC